MDKKQLSILEKIGFAAMGIIYLIIVTRSIETSPDLFESIQILLIASAIFGALIFRYLTYWSTSTLLKLQIFGGSAFVWGISGLILLYYRHNRIYSQVLTGASVVFIILVCSTGLIFLFQSSKVDQYREELG